MFMQDLGYEFPRITFLGNPVNSGTHLGLCRCITFGLIKYMSAIWTIAFSARRDRIALSHLVWGGFTYHRVTPPQAGWAVRLMEAQPTFCALAPPLSLGRGSAPVLSHPRASGSL